MPEPTQAQKDLARVQRTLSLALDMMRAATTAVAMWADSVSAEAEQRLGVGCEDPARYDDPAYAQALDMVGKCGETLAALESMSTYPYPLPGTEE